MPASSLAVPVSRSIPPAGLPSVPEITAEMVAKVGPKSSKSVSWGPRLSAGLCSRSWSLTSRSRGTRGYPTFGSQVKVFIPERLVDPVIWFSNRPGWVAKLSS